MTTARPPPSRCPAGQNRGDGSVHWPVRTYGRIDSHMCSIMHSLAALSTPGLVLVADRRICRLIRTHVTEGARYAAFSLTRAGRSQHG